MHSWERAFVALVVLVVLAGTSPAAADTPVPIAKSSDFVTLQRFDGTVHVGLESIATNSEEGAASMGVYGQYVHPSVGVGGFVRARSAIGVLYHGVGLSLGNPEAGCIYVRTLTPITIVAHVGLSAPLANDSEETLTHSRILTALPRDAHAAWSSWRGNAGISLLIHYDRIVGRLDASTAYGFGDAGLGTYLGLGVGGRLGPATLMAELSSTVGAITMRGRIGAWLPFGAVLFPLNERTQIMFDIGALVGVERQL